MSGQSKILLPNKKLAVPEKMTEHWIEQYRENRWLGLGDTSLIPTGNVFLRRNAHEIENPHEFVLDLMRKPENFGFTCKMIFGKTLAPFQVAILRELWSRPFPMVLGSRGCGKSFLLAVYAMLRGLFNQGSKIVIIGAAFRQAKVVFDYCQELWENGPVYRDIVGNDKRNGPRRDVDRVTLRIGESLICGLPIGDGCLLGNTQVTFSNGFATMDSEHSDDSVIKVRERQVWSSGQFVVSDEAYYNGVKQTKKITTKMGLVVEGTNNHSLKVLSGAKIVWKRLDEMQVGDRLLVDRSVRWHDGAEQVGIDEAYAAGLLTGDGCWTNEYWLGYASKDQELVDALRVGTGMEWKRCSESDPYHYRQHGKKIRLEWLNRWELKTCGAGLKEIPPPVMRASREVMSAFISGVFDTDGHMQIGKSEGKEGGIVVGLTTTSEKLARQIQYVLLHYGIVAYLKFRDRDVKWARVYELLMTGKNSKRFAAKIGFRLTRKQKPLEEAIAAAKRDRSSADDVPGVGAEMVRVASANRHVEFKKDAGWDSVCPSRIKRVKCVTHDLAKTFLKYYYFTRDTFLTELETLANPDIYYDTVKLIEDGEAATYDIHVPQSHEYCANGFFSHNTKIRGQRANILLVDEFATVARNIFEDVVRGFAAVSQSPVEKYRQEMKKVAMQELGLWTVAHDDLDKGTLLSNQTIVSGTAYYSFNHFYTYWRNYKAIVESKGDVRKLEVVFKGEIPENFNWRDFSVIRIPVTVLPKGFMDDKQISQAKATVDKSTYMREFSACFATDSNGFFKRSLIESCVVCKEEGGIFHPSCGEARFKACLRGTPNRRYVMAVDPASEQDNFSVVILECHPEHRRIVFCWTTTRARYKAKVKRGLTTEGDFYAYAARKIRDFMRLFNVERIGIDNQGGGVAVIEALQDAANLQPGERALYPVIIPDDPQDTDGMPGEHILEVIEFARSDWVREANHGMRKDFEDKALLFPEFDPAAIAIAYEEDKAAGRIVVDATDSSVEKLYDTLEDCVMEIEDLKDELATIVHSQTGTSMRDHWDTPETKQAGGKKGRMRKDRYSALLMANMIGRTLQRAPKEGEYRAMGGFAHTLTNENKSSSPKSSGPMYIGPSWYTEKINQIGGYGSVVKKRAD